MKILHVIDSGGLYGAEIMLLNLIAEQIPRGQNPTIASIGEKGIKEKPIEKEALKRGVDVVKFRMQPGPNFSGVMEILRYAHRENFDILHSHGYKGNILFGFVPKFIRKLPLVSTLHGWTSTQGFSKIRIYEWLDLQSLRFIDAVVVVNQIMLAITRLKKRRGINLLVVNNGIRETDATAADCKLDPKIIDFCNSGFVFGSIGRLSTEKGYKYLIEALTILVKNGLDVKLIIIGDGYERDNLEKQIRDNKLQNNIFLSGYREYAKCYLPFLNTFVMSSLTEGLPITILEAMQAKTPIVATYVGGIPDVLDNGQAGLLVKPKNPVELAKAMEMIYHDEKLAAQLTTIAYDRVSSKYSSKNMALGYGHIYQNLLKRRYTKTGEKISEGCAD